jgi:hypothetical protein
MTSTSEQTESVKPAETASAAPEKKCPDDAVGLGRFHAYCIGELSMNASSTTSLKSSLPPSICTSSVSEPS